MTSNGIPKTMYHVLEDHTDEVWNVQFSPNGNYLATCSADKTICLYEFASIMGKASKPIILIGHDAAVSFLAFSPDSTKLVSCSNDKTAKLWNVADGACLHTLSKHKDAVTAAAWMPDSKSFFTAGSRNDRSIRKWVCMITITQIGCRFW